MRLVLLAALATVLFAAPSLALDPIDPSASAGGDGNCPALTQAKYPWLSCRVGDAGVASLATQPHAATWENSRSIPRMSDDTEGDGYWGPALNPR